MDYEVAEEIVLFVVERKVLPETPEEVSDNDCKVIVDTTVLERWAVSLPPTTLVNKLPSNSMSSGLRRSSREETSQKTNESDEKFQKEKSIKSLRKT